MGLTTFVPALLLFFCQFDYSIAQQELICDKYDQNQVYRLTDLSFAGLDVNGDGKITLDELMTRFFALDANKDGIVDLTEYVTAMSPMMVKFGLVKKLGDEWSKIAFPLIDKNNDGRVTKDEAKSFHTGLANKDKVVTKSAYRVNYVCRAVELIDEKGQLHWPKVG